VPLASSRAKRAPGGTTDEHSPLLDAMENVLRYFFFDVLLSAGLPVAAAYIANWTVVNRFRIHDYLGCANSIQSLDVFGYNYVAHLLLRSPGDARGSSGLRGFFYSYSGPRPPATALAGRLCFPA
jgi:hypothetical protein